MAWVVFSRSGSPSQIPIITNAAQATQAAHEAERLSLQHLKAYDAGETLSDLDKADLQRAAAIFDALSTYSRRFIATYFGAGKIYQALGNDDLAIQRFRQGLAAVPTRPDSSTRDTATETHYLLSVSLFNKQDYPDALGEVGYAIKMLPMDSPIYLAQRASILIQMHPPRYSEATHDLLVALRADPRHKRSLGLLKLIGISASDAFMQSATDKFNKKDYKGVVQDCTSGLTVAANYPPLLVLRSASYLALGDRTKAKSDLDALLAVDPDNKDARTLLRKLKT